MNIIKVAVIVMIITFEDNNKTMYTKHVKE